MEYRYISVVITLIAGIIACGICISQKRDMMYSLVVVLTVIIIFFIIGTIAKRIIFRTLHPDPNLHKDEEEKEESEESDNNIDLQ